MSTEPTTDAATDTTPSAAPSVANGTTTDTIEGVTEATTVEFIPLLVNAEGLYEQFRRSAEGTLPWLSHLDLDTHGRVHQLLFDITMMANAVGSPEAGGVPVNNFTAFLTHTLLDGSSKSLRQKQAKQYEEEEDDEEDEEDAVDDLRNFMAICPFCGHDSRAALDPQNGWVGNWDAGCQHAHDGEKPVFVDKTEDEAATIDFYFESDESGTRQVPGTLVS